MNGRDRYKAIQKMTLEERLEMIKYMNLDELKEYGKIFDRDMKHPKPSKAQTEALNDLTDDLIKQIYIELKIKKRTGEFAVAPDLTKYVWYRTVKDIDNGVYDNRSITKEDVRGYLYG